MTQAVKGRAIKCISMLLPRMPVQHNYKVIFMTRPIAEVVASQRAMTTRLGTKGANSMPEQLERGLRAHREEVRKWAATAPHIEMARNRLSSSRARSSVGSLPAGRVSRPGTLA